MLFCDAYGRKSVTQVFKMTELSCLSHYRDTKTYILCHDSLQNYVFGCVSSSSVTWNSAFRVTQLSEDGNPRFPIPLFKDILLIEETVGRGFGEVFGEDV